MKIRTREGQIARSALKCVHFNGVQHNVCDAGVSYDTILRGPDGFTCFGECGGCEKFQAKGIDAVRKEFDEADAYAEKIEACLRAIKERHGENRGFADSMACPSCKTGTLRYSISGCNGHIHGQCSTNGCAAWMM
jgi:hypothetical protein